MGYELKKVSLIFLVGVSLLVLCLFYPVNAVGIFRNSDGNWYLDYNNTGVIDKTVRLGQVGDIPVVGDWQGTGKDGIAIFRPSTGYWYFDYNLDGIVNNSFRYGGSTDQIINGNWNGTGKDGIAIFRPSTGYWYFDYNLDGIIDKSFRFGGVGDQIIKGDWQGTGKDGIAIFRPVSGFWYFDDNLDGIIDKSFRFGGVGDQIIKGDWQGTGKDGIAIFRPASGFWYLDYNLDGIIDTSFRYGGSADRIIAGKWISFAPAAAFTSDVQSGNAPLTVRFTNQSTGTAPLTYAWDFTSDGVADSSEPSPSYIYTATGTYTVNLTVTNAGGSNTAQKIGYITVSPAPVVPAAAFTSSKQTGTVPLTVTFTDQSTGTAPFTYAWDFNNDGTRDSTSQNPSFTYQNPGTYTVKLTVTNAVGTDVETKSGYITVSPAPVAPAASFTSDKQSGTAPLTITFTDQSAGTAPLTYAWDFTNDGTRDSTSQNPSFTYQNPGTYTVKLTVTNTLGTDVETKSGYITVTPPVPPTAAFTSNKQAGTAPLTVRFTDQSAGSTPLTYAWDFTNDGVNESTTQSPSYTYSVAGTYAVRLTATNVAGSDAEIKTGYITVSPAPVAPTAAFTSDNPAGTAPLTVAFTDQSTGTAPFTYAWDFNNDGTRDSTSQNPSFTYQNTGTYTVKLTVTNAVGSDVETKNSYVTVTAVPVAPAAAFIVDKQTGNTPLTVKFTDQSTGTSPLSYSWDFDDDGITDSTTKSPTFIYTTAGIYSVNLTVTNTLGSDFERKIGHITVNPTIAPNAAFTSDVQSGDAPLKVKFTDQSTGTTPLTYAWDFTNDGTTDSTSQSPTFTYPAAGTYTVKLTVSNGAGSDVRTEPDYITVTEPPVSSRAGVAITFDDNTVDQWYAIRDILNRNNAHATFFVSQYEGLDQDQINKLKTLKADGNEIAFHGMYHTDVVDYLNSHSVQQYIDYEITPGINLMTNDGLAPVDFAYPNGSDDPAATLALEAYFGHIRDTHYDWDDMIYYQYGSNQAFIAGIGMDESYGHSMTEIYDGISLAKTDDKILIFYGHEPVPSNPGSYQTSYDRLENILKYVSDNNLKTFTISEIH